MFQKTIIITILSSLLSFNTYAISIENDNFDFNTFGQVGTDFGSNFNYYYNENTKVVSKSTMKTIDKSYQGNLDSAYVSQKISSNWTLRVGKMPLIDNVDYQNLGEDIKKIAIDDKINNYDGTNVRYKKTYNSGDLHVSNILGRIKTTRNNDDYYDNVVGSNFIWKSPDYRVRLGHSIIEPNIGKNRLNSHADSSGMITSAEINYYWNNLKHSNEVIRKNYYYNDKEIHTFKTNVSYYGNNITPYAEYIQEFDQWENGQQVFASGIQLKVKDYLEIKSDCKKIYRTFSDYDNYNQNSNEDLVLSLGLTLKY